jgi:hypothetical protein
MLKTSKISTVKARFKNGAIELLEDLKLTEGEEFILTIARSSEIKLKKETFKKSRGGWKGLLDCEELKRNIYEDRLIQTRSEAKV